MRCSVTPATASHPTSRLPLSSPTLQESPPPDSYVKSATRSSRQSRVWRCTNRQSMKEWSSTVSSALTVRQPSQTWKCTFRRNTPSPNPCTSSPSQPEPFNISKRPIWETMLLIWKHCIMGQGGLGFWISFVSHCILEAKMSNSYWNFLKLLLMQHIWLFVSIYPAESLTFVNSGVKIILWCASVNWMWNITNIRSLLYCLQLWWLPVLGLWSL